MKDIYEIYKDCLERDLRLRSFVTTLLSYIEADGGFNYTGDKYYEDYCNTMEERTKVSNLFQHGLGSKGLTVDNTSRRV